MMKDIWAAAIGLLLMLLIIYLAYIFSKFIAARAYGAGRCKYMKEQDRLAMGPEQFISIVKIGNGYYLIGVTKQNINMIAELTEDNMKEIEQIGIKTSDSVISSKFFRYMKSRVTDINTLGRRSDNSGKEGEE